MSNSEHNETTVQLWEHIFARMAEADVATIENHDYDNKAGEENFGSRLAEAGWSKPEIEERIESHKAKMSGAPVTSPGVAPHVEALFEFLCNDVKAAMGRLNLKSNARVARGVEPRVGVLASMINVTMTDQGIVTVGSFLFRFCGLIGRAFARMILMDHWLWESRDYSDASARSLLRTNPALVSYWAQIFLSYSTSGTNMFVPFRPANKSEAILCEQAARAMEIFAIAYEYGHRHLGHGRQQGDDPQRDEFDADQFALRICYEVERYPSTVPNPYLSSGSGGVILLLALETFSVFRKFIAAERVKPSTTYPPITQRLDRFDSVSAFRPHEHAQLKGFRTASVRIMQLIDLELLKILNTVPPDTFDRFRAQVH